MKRSYTLCAVLLALSSLLSCKKDGDIQTQNLVLTATEQQQADADNTFAFKLLNKVALPNTGNKNLMLSPLSLSMAMGMTSNGSNGQTLDSIRTTFGWSNFTEEQMNSYYHHLLTALPSLDAQSTVNIANSIWYRNTLTVAAPFLQTNTSYYNATVKGLDFSSASAKDEINNWVNTQTNGKIPTIVSNISNETMMYLINAVYFKSSWEQQFDKNRTTKGVFKNNDSTQVQTDFMSASVKMNAYQTQDLGVYELPYSNNKYSMVIVEPAPNNNITSIMRKLDGTQWKSWMTSLQEGSRDIQLPKFKFSYDQSLVSALIGLGMGRAFNNNADFTRISTGGGLKLTDVKQKTYVEVNEEGTTAAAATSVVIGVTSIAPITINRPFLFVIREKQNGLILFTGIVNNPTLTE